MKMVYEILYKNGKEDKIIQEVNDETVALLHEINQMIEKAMQEDISVVVTFGDGKSGGYYVRVSDVSRVKLSVEEC